MLETLKLRNFTAFADAEFQFSSGLNVLVGENATGKTHVLKLAYAASHACARSGREPANASPAKAQLQGTLANKLMGVFKPDEIGRLVRRDRRGRQRCDVQCTFGSPQAELAFSFTANSKAEIVLSTAPSRWLDKVPAYLPTRELLTIYPGFVSLYETTHLSFDETWRDTCILLGAPLAKGRREQRIRQLLAPLENAMGGKVEVSETGRFYLHADGCVMEMHLVAEGLRKLAMIARLIATGALVEQGCLFWDEPESNLNPKIIKLAARTILHLCQAGIRVVLATHSLFLMRELYILLQADEFKGAAARFFGLHRTAVGVEVRQGESIDDIGDITALQEELSQSDRYLATEAK